MKRWTWIGVGVVTLLGAGVAVFFAASVRVLNCIEEASSPCSNESLGQLVVAIGGLIPAVGTLVQSIRRSGHPLPWFLATAVVYALWGIYVWREFGS